MVNCIGAGLTLGLKDTLRIYSYDMKPEPTFAQIPTICSVCEDEDDNRTHCDDCEEVLLLLNCAHHVTRKFFNMVARPTYANVDTSDTAPCEQVIKKIRYHQNIARLLISAPVHSPSHER